MSPHVLGLDLALAHAGAAQLHQDGRLYTFRKDTDPLGDHAPIAIVSRRIRDIAKWAIERATADTVLVVIEGPSHNSEYGQPHERGGLWWRVAEAFDRHGIPIGKVAPTTLKHRITGNGHASKDQVRKSMAKLYPGQGLIRASYDENDAAALASLGVLKLAAIHGRSGPWRGPWLEAGAINIEVGCQWPGFPDVAPPAVLPPVAVPVFRS